MDDDSRDFLTIAQTCKFFGVGRSTLARWVRNGKLQSERVAGRPVIPIEEIVRLIVVHGQPWHISDDIRFVFSRAPPLPFDSPRSLRDDEVEQALRAIAAVMWEAGAPLYPPGLAPLIKGELMPQPIFWRYLTLGIERLLHPPKPWRPSDQEVAAIQALAKRAGIGFWEAAMKMHPIGPPQPQDAKEPTDPKEPSDAADPNGAKDQSK